MGDGYFPHVAESVEDTCVFVYDKHKLKFASLKIAILFCDMVCKMKETDQYRPTVLRIQLNMVIKFRLIMLDCMDPCVTRYVDGTPTSEVTPVTIWYIHPPHHG